jgi:hypothetical protein
VGGQDEGQGVKTRVADMSHASSDSPNSPTLRIILGAGFLIACWNFLFMFRGWVVASEAEITGANILFIFLGVVPWFGLIAASRRKRWGAWIVLISPLLALTGLVFTKNDEWAPILIAMGITVVPTVVIGVVLLKVVGRQIP